MTNRIESKIPFVGLHAHSGLSPFDGLGMPGEHMDFAYENGMNAHSLTDHGHMNGLSFQVEHLLTLMLVVSSWHWASIYFKAMARLKLHQ